jgi:hypothetical protein
MIKQRWDLQVTTCRRIIGSATCSAVEGGLCLSGLPLCTGRCIFTPPMLQRRTSKAEIGISSPSCVVSSELTPDAEASTWRDHVRERVHLVELEVYYAYQPASQNTLGIIQAGDSHCKTPRSKVLLNPRRWLYSQGLRTIRKATSSYGGPAVKTIICVSGSEGSFCKRYVGAVDLSLLISSCFFCRPLKIRPT